MPLRWALGILVLAVLLQLFPVDRMIWHRQEENHHIFIGVLSARNHYEQRAAIRQSWMQQGRKHHSLSLSFIVGTHPCPVPPSFRHNRYSCLWNDSFNLAPVPEFSMEPLHVVPARVYGRADDDKVVLRFECISSVLVEALAVFDSGADGLYGPLTAVLKHAQTGQKLAERVFRPATPGRLEGSLRILNLTEPIRLRPGDTVDLECRGFSRLDPFSDTLAHHLGRVNGAVGGALTSNWTHNSAGNRRFPVVAGTLVVSSVAGISAMETAQVLTERRVIETGYARETLSVEEARLESEARRHGDVTLLDMNGQSDVYRALPHKTLAMVAHAYDKYDATAVIKVDDDCYVNVDGIMQELAAVDDEDSSSSVWWARFRTHWAVESRGKWHDPDYTSLTYPPFAAGGGHALIGRTSLLAWLAHEHRTQRLHVYQGEDVSLGIWLAAHEPQPRLWHDERWHVLDTCRSDALTLPQLSSEQIVRHHHNHIRCGNICTCPEIKGNV